MSKLSNTIRSIFLTIVCTTVIVTITGCSSTEEVTPVPVPVADTREQIIGKWECIDSQNTTTAFTADFKPDGVMIYTDSKNNKVTEFKYAVVDNNTLALVIKEKDAVKVTIGVKCKINGSIMYWSFTGRREHGESYTVVLTLHKLK